MPSAQESLPGPKTELREFRREYDGKNSPPRRVIDLPCWQINDSSPEKNQQNTNGLVAGPGWKIEADE